MPAIGKHFVLQRQIRAAGIHQINAGQPILRGDFLRAQMLFHAERVIRAAFYRGVIGDDHAFAPANAADAGDQPGRRNFVGIDFVRGELRQFQKRRGRIQQPAHPLARREFSAGDVFFARRRAATLRDFFNTRAQVAAQRVHVRRVF